jgi:UDP-hydrolysing UDP-N-acetyl-D-glucosamine 2-epimerase
MARTCCITLSRSDYASMRPVILAAMNAADIDLQVIAGGSHLLQRFGHSITQIAEDGINITAQVAFLRETDNSDADLATAYARAVTGFVETLSTLRPDNVFIIGDRWEMLAVATAASMLRIPIIHHSGGDITQGSADNQTRYALSVLSHLHLVALEEHKQRLVHMGEEPWRITVTGEPALTQLKALQQSDIDIRHAFNMPQNAPFVLATFHPTSYELHSTDKQADIFLSALSHIKAPILLTAPNPDAESGAMLSVFEAFATRNSHVHLTKNLGSARYYAAMQQAAYMIGNSSSGLWEAPSFKLPVINIGLRQKGRAHGDNLVDVPLEINAILAAITQVQQSDFKAKITDKNPYLLPDTLERILTALRQPHDRKKLLAKQLIDPLYITTKQR